jgi:CrcB protein
VKTLYIVLAGVAGTLARYGCGRWIQGPVGTLAVNLAGSLAAGFLVRHASTTIALSPNARAALTIGFCGAFTTMSSFSYESIGLLWSGDYWRAGLYIGATIGGCLVAVALGMTLASKLA